MLASIGRAEQHLRALIQRIRRDGGHRDRRDPRVVVRHRRRPRAVGGHGPWGDVLHLAVFRVPPRQAPPQSRSVDDVGILRVGDVVVALVGPDGVPIAESDRAVVAAACDRHRAVVLLSAVDPVRETVVGGEVVELAGRLVVPAAPGRSPVHGDDGALIRADDHPLGMSRIDPKVVVVIPAGGALEELARRSARGATADRPPHDEHSIRVAGQDRHVAEVVAPQPPLAVDPYPGRAAVVGPIEAAVIFGINSGVHARGFFPVRHAQPNPAKRPRRPSGALDGFPGTPPVARSIKSALFAFARIVVTEPGFVTRVPDRGENDVGRGRVAREVDGAAVLADEQGSLPRRAAIFGAVNAALGIRVERVTHRGDEHDVGVTRIDEDRADVPGLLKADRRPGRARVFGLEDSFARRSVVARGHLPRPDVDRLRVGRGDRQRADRRRPVIEDRRPGSSRIGRLPDAAPRRAEVERLRLLRDTRGDGAPSRAVRPDEPEGQTVQHGVGNGGRREGRRSQGNEQGRGGEGLDEGDH